jgi:hypothetical protein
MKKMRHTYLYFNKKLITYHPALMPTDLFYSYPVKGTVATNAERLTNLAAEEQGRHIFVTGNKYLKNSIYNA